MGVISVLQDEKKSYEDEWKWLYNIIDVFFITKLYT